jgi:hypothetical protein
MLPRSLFHFGLSFFMRNNAWGRYHGKPDIEVIDLSLPIESKHIYAKIQTSVMRIGIPASNPK